MARASDKVVRLLKEARAGLDELRWLLDQADAHLAKGEHMKAWLALDKARNYEDVRKRTNMRGFFSRIKDALPVRLVTGDKCPECGGTVWQSGSYLTCDANKDHVFSPIVKCARKKCRRRSVQFINTVGYCKEHGEAAWLGGVR